MKHRLAFFTSTRSDMTIFEPLLNEIKKNKNFEYLLFVHGTHLEKNYGNTIQSFNATIFDFVFEDGKKVVKKAGSSFRGLSELLSIKPNFFSLNPNESIDLQLILTVNKEDINTHWGYVFIGPTTEQTDIDVDKSLLSSGLIMKPKIDVLITQSPKINQNFKCEIVDFYEIPNEDEKIRTFRTHIKNSGDKVLSPDVHLEFGVYETAELFKFQSFKKTIFPSQSEEFDLSVEKDKLNLKGQLALILDYGHNSQIDGKVIEINP